MENSVDPDQLASKKPADLDLHCFLLYLLNKICLNKEIISWLGWSWEKKSNNGTM